MVPRFRRRILIDPGPGVVTAELEDDWHRMVVTLRHDGQTVTGVTAQMKRSPWTTCPAAMDVLERTVVGKALAGIAQREERLANCTHLHDLALFAAAHFAESHSVAYDVTVTDPVDGLRHATLDRDNVRRLDWTIGPDGFTAPAELAGLAILQLNGWIATLDDTGREAARILRWAVMLSNGRQMDIAAHSTSAPFPLGSCYTFQPDVAPVARRRAGADMDFSSPGTDPMADRNEAFSF